MCDCKTKTSEIKYDGSKLVCPTNADLLVRSCDDLNTIIQTLFSSVCQPSLFVNTNTPYNTAAAYPVAGGAGSTVIPADGTYFISGNMTCEVPDGTTLTSAILLNGVAIAATEKAMINSSGATQYMNISYIYEGVLAENDVIQIGAKDVGSAAAVYQSELYYKRNKS